MKVKDLPPWPDMKQAITRTLLRDWPEMGSWLNGFFSNDVCDLVRKTVAHDPQDSYILVQEVLWNCYKAATFSHDPHKSLRQLDSEFRKNRLRAHPAIKKLRDLLRRYPEQTGWTVARANALCRNRFPGAYARLSYVGNDGMPFSQLLDQFLESLDESFHHPVPRVLNGSFLHRFQAGTLHFTSALDLQNSQPDIPLNGLIFALAFHFRRATSGEQGKPWQNGCPMPTTGKPCIPLITSYAAVVFPNYKKLNDDTVKDRLSYLTDRAVLTYWPK